MSFTCTVDSPQTIPFDLVFLIRLRYVNTGSTLAKIIQKQHDELEDIPTEYIESIIKGKANTSFRVLLMLDGYDEYTPGTNRDVDRAIESVLGNCFLILTSRPGDYLRKEIRNKMDGEIIIVGFSKEKIKECSTKYLRSAEKSQQMLKQAKEAGIHELLHIPIILIMTLVVFLEENSLPKSKTGLYKTIFRLIMDRTTLKTLSSTSANIPNLEDLLYSLGKLS